MSKIEIVELGALKLVGRRSTSKPESISRSMLEVLSTVWDAIRANDGKTLGLNAAIYFGAATPGRRDGEISFVAGVLVEDYGGLPAPLEAVDTPSGLCAHLEHWGDYGLLPAAHRSVRDWCRGNGRGLSGTSLEIYGHWNDDPSKVKTDIYYLLD